MKFIVDSREQNSGIPALLREMAIDFEMAEMAAGDYRICDTLIERKSANDLAASILDGRLFGQIEAMCAVSSKPILLVEGSLASVRNQLHEDALAGDQRPGAVLGCRLYRDGRYARDFAPLGPLVAPLGQRPGLRGAPSGGQGQSPARRRRRCSGLHR